MIAKRSPAAKVTSLAKAKVAVLADAAKETVPIGAPFFGSQVPSELPARCRHNPGCR
jgi:hypothetical protein